jgi:hypothetical protein
VQEELEPLDAVERALWAAGDETGDDQISPLITTSRL